ncbi:MAG: sigma-70 family RNA polymerase sigma factor [Vicinamibacterales bacterium]
MLPADDPLSSGSLVPPFDPEATAHLLQRARDGDDDALNRLLERCLPPLRRYAHGLIPPHLRGPLDTGDLVQETVIAALRSLHRFEARGEGALQAYLRAALRNKVVDLLRSSEGRVQRVEVPEALPAREPSPLEQAVGKENVERLEAALARLDPEDAEAIVCRFMLLYSYAELAVALGKPSADAARMTVTRAMKRLGQTIESVPD